MAGVLKYPYIRDEIVKYEKNIMNVPEVFGRLIVAVSSYVEYLQLHEYLLCNHLDEIFLLVYRNRPDGDRRKYIRNFVQRKRLFLLHFIRTNGIKLTTYAGFKFQRYTEVGLAALREIHDFNQRECEKEKTGQCEKDYATENEVENTEESGDDLEPGEKEHQSKTTKQNEEDRELNDTVENGETERSHAEQGEEEEAEDRGDQEEENTDQSEGQPEILEAVNHGAERERNHAVSEKETVDKAGNQEDREVEHTGQIGNDHATEDIVENREECRRDDIVQGEKERIPMTSRQNEETQEVNDLAENGEAERNNVVLGEDDKAENKGDRERENTGRGEEQDDRAEALGNGEDRERSDETRGKGQQRERSDSGQKEALQEFKTFGNEEECAISHMALNENKDKNEEIAECSNVRPVGSETSGNEMNSKPKRRRRCQLELLKEAQAFLLR